jgi:uncharacterized Zn finger protein
MAMFKLNEYDENRELRNCPNCGQDENVARVLEAHPWRKLEGPDADGNYTITAEGEDHEVRCECGHVYWVPGRASIYA